MVDGESSEEYLAIVYSPLDTEQYEATRKIYWKNPCSVLDEYIILRI